MGTKTKINNLWHGYLDCIETAYDKGLSPTKLLKLIDEMPDVPFEGVSKTDWPLPPSVKRKYLELFYAKVIKSSMNKLQDHFKAGKWYIGNAWFQQYDKD